MHFGMKQCVQCGLDPIAGEGYTRFQGKINPGDHARPKFCSEECFTKAVRPDYERFFASHRLQHQWSRSDVASNASLYPGSEQDKFVRAIAVIDQLDEDLGTAKLESWAYGFGQFAATWRDACIKHDQAFIAKHDADQHKVLLRQSVQWEKERVQREKVELQEAQERAALEDLEAKIKPRVIPDVPFRFEHTHILAPSGQGKTTLIQHLLLKDLKKDNPPGLIIIDPKGEMIDRISRLELFDPHNGRLRDRLIVIDPTHEPPFPLNMFRVSQMEGLTAGQQRRVTNHLTETFAYIFSSANSALTQKQSVPFAFLVRLIFFMGGDVNTLMDLLDDTAKTRTFAEPIAAFSKHDPGAHRFFSKDFYEGGFKETKGQIKARVFDLFKNPDLMQMFTAQENSLDLAQCLRERKIVLVNTSLAQLGTSGSQMLGRYIIAMALNATFARSTILKSQWHPAYLVIDEFQNFADGEKTPELLRLAREYNVGVTLAHTTMHGPELDESIRTAISTNTSIKYCASPAGVDVNYMSRDLQCDPSFLRAQERTDTHAKFACYVRGMRLQHPFVVQCPLGEIDGEPQIKMQPPPNAATPQRSAPAPTQQPPSLFDSFKSAFFSKPQPPAPVVPIEVEPSPPPPAPTLPPKPVAKAAPIPKAVIPASDDDEPPGTRGS